MSSPSDNRRDRLAAERAEQRRKEHRNRLLVRGGLGLAGLALVGGVTALVVTQHSSTPTATAAAGSTGIPAQPRTTADGRTTAPPWDAPAGSAVDAAVRAAGLPMLTTEGTVEHIHAHLDVYADGKAVTVPGLIGIDEPGQQISPVHTHDTSGIIHIESPVQATFSLGQFMTEWQVSLSANHLGGLSTDSAHTLTAYVNGKPVTGDPAAVTLGAHDEIALVYGTASENAQVTVPGSYSFPSGL
ncbi:hypothetical protein [Kitasatospora sp. MAP5-34]|uniref:hypothetical protein n=1 Tax=Kitasatospora sp. MAP5-34 TaxID=3035102 RepID=UPI0024745B94|nr:hypothetical protein [Kitasatospora sp. MAP5-34]MDH6576098.1 hypothetical protein [Kitasatospora sp. MAP5-34]